MLHKSRQADLQVICASVAACTMEIYELQEISKAHKKHFG